MVKLLVEVEVRPFRISLVPIMGSCLLIKSEVAVHVMFIGNLLYRGRAACVLSFAISVAAC